MTDGGLKVAARHVYNNSAYPSGDTDLPCRGRDEFLAEVFYPVSAHRYDRRPAMALDDGFQCQPPSDVILIGATQDDRLTTNHRSDNSPRRRFDLLHPSTIAVGANTVGFKVNRLSTVPLSPSRGLSFRHHQVRMSAILGDATRVLFDNLRRPARDDMLSGGGPSPAEDAARRGHDFPPATNLGGTRNATCERYTLA